jgi:hypothetical protein
VFRVSYATVSQGPKSLAQGRSSWYQPSISATCYAHAPLVALREINLQVRISLGLERTDLYKHWITAWLCRTGIPSSSGVRLVSILTPTSKQLPHANPTFLLRYLAHSFHTKGKLTRLQWSSYSEQRVASGSWLGMGVAVLAHLSLVYSPRLTALDRRS